MKRILTTTTPLPIDRGEYDPSETYYRGNLVQHGDLCYKVVSDTPLTGIEPSAETNGWAVFWNPPAIAARCEDKIDRLDRDLAQYDEDAPITLIQGQNNNAVGSNGVVATKTNYAVSQPVHLKKGFIYLYKPSNNQPIDNGVALCARLITSQTPVVVDYVYTYDEQGRIATATATYDNTLVYTYQYTNSIPTITDKNGEVVIDIPAYRIVAANSYVPMFTSLSDTTPGSGYYAILCSEDCEAVWSAPKPLGDVLVVSYGIVRSIANQKADKAMAEKMRDDVDALQEQKEADAYRFAELCREVFKDINTGLYAKIKAGTTCYGVEANATRDTWVWLPKPTYNSAENKKIIEIAYVGQWSAIGNCSNLISVKGYEVSEKGSYWDYLFPDNKLKRIDFSQCKKVGGGYKRATFKSTELEELILPKAGVVLEGGDVIAAWSTFAFLPKLKYLDLSMIDSSNALCLWNTFADSGFVELDLSTWNTKKLQELKDTFNSMQSLRYLNLKNWDMRSATSINGTYLYRHNRDLYIDVSPSFFLAKSTIGFRGSCNSIGWVYATGEPLMHPKNPDDTRNWLEMIAETAPIIRLADGWDQDVWNADKLEVNEDTPHLLTEEDGVWYINDGIARTIQLHGTLKAKAWAQEPIAILASKGYSVI